MNTTRFPNIKLFKLSCMGVAVKFPAVEFDHYLPVWLDHPNDKLFSLNLAVWVWLCQVVCCWIRPWFSCLIGGSSKWQAYEWQKPCQILLDLAQEILFNIYLSFLYINLSPTSFKFPSSYIHKHCCRDRFFQAYLWRSCVGKNDENGHEENLYPCWGLEKFFPVGCCSRDGE